MLTESNQYCLNEVVSAQILDQESLSLLQMLIASSHISSLNRTFLCILILKIREKMEEHKSKLIGETSLKRFGSWFQELW